MKNLKPAVVDGKVVEDYFICSEGNIWSKKQSGFLKKMSPAFGGSTKYPKTVITIDGKQKSVRLHRVVCETFHQFPIPDGISKSEWSKTPASVKMLLRSLYQVNHIDHDHGNHHPSNLEWVTVKQNAKKYQEHRTATVWF